MRDLLDLLVDLRTASRSHQLVRALILVGGVLFCLGLFAAGGAGWANVTMALVVTLMVVVQPHTLAPGLFLAVTIGMWWAAVDGWHWGLLPATLGVMLGHVAAALCASTPPQAVIPEVVLRSWASRSLLVAAVTVGVWGVAGLLTTRTWEGLGALPGIVGLAVLAAGLVGYLLWRGRTDPSRPNKA